MPIQSRIRRTVPADIQTVWRTVTSLTDYAWRSDVQKIEPLSATQFREYGHSGAGTLFTVTQSRPPHLWAFDMENDTFSGHWVGRFTALANGRTELDFTESLTLKKRLPRWLVKLYLRRQQQKYCRDLCRKLQQTPPEAQ
ncbi:SRPBCC family protein [Eikenella sp. S3360]|uniref:SRPBCC family protein n=1 Tax=Eikenella glucosivorans TaxID=2766967 RepID=A0ABS0N9M2_9NEIS|nr:SRPBCC family protein [Eikenella glucosivorans]MBH5328970.1 SRPBCC family protein [Eikenella glucosivorans]